ncbi:hypothetical protein AB0F64_39765 [Streptomyces sp. NPDC026294]|uniref:hypothetical protein n=1 Tax=Streptomyces sp. NPDC026294 TaxID=3155362 RepID=UPI003411D332
MPLPISDDVQEPQPSKGRPPRYRIAPAGRADYQAVKALVKARTSWMRDQGFATDPVEPPVLSHLRAGVMAGAQVWVLYEGTLLRGAAVTSTSPTVDLQWHQDPNSESLWLHDMYTDPDAHDAPGRWMTWWLSQHYCSSLAYVFAALCDEVLARKFARDHVMELHPTEDQVRPFLLRRRTAPAPRLHTAVASAVPPPAAPARLRR